MADRACNPKVVSLGDHSASNHTPSDTISEVFMNQLPINLTLYYPTYQQFENYLGFCALLSIALLIHYVFYWIAFAVKRPNLDGIVASALLPLAVLVASVLIYIPSAAASPRVYNALVVFAFLSPLLGLYVFSYFGLLG